MPSHPSRNLAHEYGEMLVRETGAQYDGRNNARASREFLSRHRAQGSTIIVGPGLGAMTDQGELPPDLLGEFQTLGDVVIADFCGMVLDDIRRALVKDVPTLVEFDASFGISAAFHELWSNVCDSLDTALDLSESPDTLVSCRALQSLHTHIISKIFLLRNTLVSQINGEDAEREFIPEEIRNIQDCQRIILHSVLDGMFACTERDVRASMQRDNWKQSLPAFHVQISTLNTFAAYRLICALLEAHPHARILCTFARNTQYEDASAASTALDRMNLSLLESDLSHRGIQTEHREDLPRVRHSDPPLPHTHEMSCVEFYRSEQIAA